ncbi:MAG: hypothetical protein HY088_03875 [Ignavibacteriales bacterium]|nr:hypothetical protein [Ignavibacteriales bacterium]
MRTFIKFYVVFFALVVLSLNGCSDSTPSGPTPGLGSVTVKKYVSVGNSLTAGYQSNSLYASGQAYSYPNLIASQLKAAGASLGNFEQPLYSDPGTPDAATGKSARMEIISLTGPVIGSRGLTPGAPSNLSLTRPYDNMGIPGIPLASFMDETNFLKNPLVDAVVRSAAGMPKSIYKQVVALQPDLITFWLGANDVLGYATSGGVSPSAPTPSTAFAALYAQALDSLRRALPNAKIVVANIPNVSAIPFFNTVGPVLASNLAALNLTMYYQKKGESGLATGTTKLNEATPPLITLKGSTYAVLLGRPTGQWYTDNKYPALPAGIDTTKPFALHPQNPWPNALVLDADEQTIAAQAITDFNNTIATVAAAKGAAVFDAFSFFNKIKAQGYSTQGETYTTAYISGGLFSLDGVHPSSRGYGIVANEFLRVMNSSFSMSIPFVDISQIPGIPAPLAKASTDKTGMPVIPFSAFENFDKLFSQSADQK